MADPYRWGDRLEQVVTLHAETDPDRVAVCQDASVLTYGELLQGARRVAAGLQERGVGRGDVVAIDLGRTPELVVSVLGVLLADATYTVIDPGWPPERRTGAIADARCSVVVDPSVHRALRASGAPLAPVVGDGRDVAAIFYTSGSTGRPKGIRSPHRGPIRTLVGHGDLPLDRDSVVLQAAALPWDGLSLEMWAPLLNGGELRLLPGRQQVLDSALLERLVADGLDTLWLTSSLFNVLAESSAPILGRLRLLMVGGERVSAPHVARVLDEGGPVRVVNGYGPAETTIFATTRVLTRPIGTEVPIGRAVPRTDLRIVDPLTGRSDVEQGELWIAGDGLTVGYLDPGDETGRFASVDGQRYYRSGDLVRLQDGELWFEGRVDDQVKIGGVRIDPAQVESIVSSLPGVASCHVTVTDDVPERRRLVCLYVATDGRPLPEGDLRARSAERMIGAMVPSHWIHVDGFALTPQGKIDRDAVRGVVTQRVHRAEAVESEDDLELVRSITGLDDLGWDDDVVDAVHSSLQLVRLAGHLSGRWNRAVSVADWYDRRSLAAVRALGPAQGGSPPARVEAEGESSRPSRAELRFWLAEQLSPGTCDNMLVLAHVIDLPGVEDRLVGCVRQIVHENESLRTIYVDDGDLPRVELVDASAIVVERVRTDEVDAGSAARALTDPWWERPFRLDAEAPFRAAVLTLGDGRVVLGLHVHHIAFDGWSEMLFIDRLEALLTGDPGDVGGGAVGAAVAHDPAAVQEARTYWKDVTRRLPEAVLPAPARTGEQPRLQRTTTLDTRVTRAITDAGARRGLHPLGPCVSAVAGALCEVLERDEVCIGTVVSERRDADAQETMGYFVNPVALVLTDVRATGRSELTRLAATRIGAAERHGILSFDDVVPMARQTDATRHPVFQVWAVLQHARNSRQVAPSVRIRPLTITPPRTAIELMVEIVPTDGTWEVVTFWREDGIDDVVAEAVHAGVVDRLATMAADLEAAAPSDA